MPFNLIYNYLCKIGIMCLFTYSSNLILLIQKIYDEQVFIDAAFVFSILLLFYTFLGGSIRMLSENKINNSLISSSFIFRLYGCLDLRNVYFFILEGKQSMNLNTSPICFIPSSAFAPGSCKFEYFAPW